MCSGRAGAVCSGNLFQVRWVLTGPGGFDGFGHSGFRWVRKGAAVSQVMEFRGLMGSDGFEGFGF